MRAIVESRVISSALWAVFVLGCGAGGGTAAGAVDASPGDGAGARTSPDAAAPPGSDAATSQDSAVTPPAESGAADTGPGDTGAGSDAGTFNPSYPRLCAYAIGAPQTYDANFRAIAAKLHVVIVANWQGYSGDLPNMAAVFQDIKTRSTIGTKLFSYVNDNETETWMEHTLLTEIAAQKWYLYPSGTSGTPVPSAYAGATEANNTLFPKPDSNGKIWSEWYTDFRYGAFVAGDSLDAPNPYGDGFFMDNVFWAPRVDGDWNLDGVSDSMTDPTVQGWYRAGYQHYVNYVRSIWPNSVQLGNVADWGEPAATLGVYDQMLNGGVLEGMFGETWSVETYAGFAGMMAAYKKTMAALAPPKLGLLGDDQAPTDYQGMRYGLASTLMDDGYYYHATGSSYAPPPLWYDEYNFNLGHPLSTTQGAPQDAAWAQGVWRRDFDNGIVLVNPKGNGAQTVQLGGTFKKLSGTQDPTVNDGSTVTQVTLADRDGILLSR